MEWVWRERVGEVWLRPHLYEEELSRVSETSLPPDNFIKRLYIRSATQVNTRAFMATR